MTKTHRPATATLLTNGKVLVAERSKANLRDYVGQAENQRAEGEMTGWRPFL
jgi:hypothetical protein